MERPANLEFSERLKGAMKRADVKGKDLAEFAGVTPNTVTDWRNGLYLPEGERLSKVAAALTVTEQWLVYGDRQAVPGASLSAAELRGYAIAVRDMLENARVLQQRVIDGLAADHPVTVAERPAKPKRQIPANLMPSEQVLKTMDATHDAGAAAARKRRTQETREAARKSGSS